MGAQARRTQGLPRLLERQGEAPGRRCPVSAELAARRNAAAAGLADFRATEAAVERGLRDRPAYPAWALRLEQHLHYVLAELDAQDVVVGAGPVTLTAGQAAVVTRALADAETYRLQRAAAWCEDCKTHPA